MPTYASSAQQSDWPVHWRGDESLACAFRAGSPAGQHALRTAARATLLKAKSKCRARLDEGGIDLIDLEAASHPKWRAFLRTLNFRQRAQLDVRISRAIWNPTRRYSSPNDHRIPEAAPSPLEKRHPPPVAKGSAPSRKAAKACTYCGYSSASSRHFVARCPAFARIRVFYARSFSENATEDLFDTLPDCTVKTAWVTIDAHPEPERRVDLQIALANLGLDILFSPDETLRGEPHWTTAQEVAEVLEAAAANHAPCPASPLQPHPAIIAVISNMTEDIE